MRHSWPVMDRHYARLLFLSRIETTTMVAMETLHRQLSIVFYLNCTSRCNPLLFFYLRNITSSSLHALPVLILGGFECICFHSNFFGLTVGISKLTPTWISYTSISLELLTQSYTERNSEI